MNVRSSSIMADILHYISDGKFHTLQEIADEVEVSRITAYRHIQSLSYRYNIESFHGGDKRGGIRLIPDKKVSIEKLTSDDLQLIISKLESLQDSNPRIKSFINKLSTNLEFKEIDLWEEKN